METAKIFRNGGSQAAPLPKGYRFSGDEALIQKIGNAIPLTPKETAWETFLEGLNGFTDDFFQDGRKQDAPQTRESL